MASKVGCLPVCSQRSLADAVIPESRDAIAEPEPPAMPQDLVNGSSVAEVGPSGSDSRVVEDDEPVGAVNYPDLNRVIRQESEDYELEKPVSVLLGPLGLGIP